jgi:hypothetical protein
MGPYYDSAVFDSHLAARAGRTGPCLLAFFARAQVARQMRLELESALRLRLARYGAWRFGLPRAAGLPRRP